MSRRWRVLAVIVVVLVAVFAGIRRFAFLAVERNGLIGAPNGSETPATFGAPFEQVSIRSGDRTLDATLVRAESDSGPALLIFHGTGEAVSYWADTQALLRRHGVTSMVFDYSGFGRSTGKATAAHIEEDADSAYADFVRRVGPRARPFVLGYSLGTGVVFDAVQRWAPQPKGVVFVASYSSAREGAVAFGLVPRWATFLLPDVWNNVRGTGHLTQPLLVVQSDADQLFPVSMAKAVFDAATVPKEMAVLHGYRHEDGHQRPTDEFWAPVVRFLSKTAR
ncbi:MAG TPA: alpha/beta fold hydrolase [Gemmatimonadaceae bacterium]|nr:alpha/beta fold hydrolase [Gemmatimonadaceae bacterium]